MPFQINQSGVDLFTLTSAQPQQVNLQDSIVVSQQTTVQAFTAVELPNVQLWAVDVANAQALASGGSFTGISLNTSGFGLSSVVLPAGTWYLAASTAGLTGAMIAPGMISVSALTFAGSTGSTNVPLGSFGYPGSFRAQAFTVTGNPHGFIETEATGGKFAVMTQAQYQAFLATYSHGYNGGPIAFVQDLGNGIAGSPATHIEGEVALAPGSYELVWFNDTNAWAGGAGNVTFVSDPSTPGASGGPTGTGVADTLVTTLPSSDADYVVANLQFLSINAGDGNDTVFGATAPDTLQGGNGNDLIIGGSMVDSISGGAGDDSLSGGSGNDQIDGGAGADTAGYVASRASLAVSYAGGGAYHVTDLTAGSPEGSDTVVNVEYLRFAGVSMSIERALLNTNAAIADFDGDGKADIVWRNQASGLSVIWQMNEGHNTGAGGVTDAFADTSYSLIGTGDFNGDGKADLLWRNDTTGTTVVWDQSGTHLLNGGATSVQVGNDWYVAGVADFNGDGKADILWRNLDSHVSFIWNMNGATLIGAGPTDAFAPAGWSVAGTGDFNGDGKADILWRNDADGSTVIWQENGTQLVAAGFTSANAPAPWTVAAVADFNGDGKADILWRDVQTGQSDIWTMNGTNLVTAGLTDAFAPVGWSVAGTGDFNGDGNADILWRNDSTQQSVIWEMNGQHLVTSSLTDTFAPSGWVFT